MKQIILLTTLCFYGIYTGAQSPIVLQNAGGVFIHPRLDTIMAHAGNGCSIYLPGGTLILHNELIIDKEVHIYGAGHYPDSSAATGVTCISGANIRFTSGSSHSSLTGFYFTNDLYFARSTTDTVRFIDVTRCNLNAVYLGYISAHRNSNNSNIHLAENVIRYRLAGADAQYCLIEKNIIDGVISYFTGGCTFTNNIFNYEYAYSDVFSGCSGLLVTNNIFTRDNHGLTSSQIYNNIFSLDVPAEPGGTNLGSGNIGNQPLNVTLVNFDGGLFNYSYDYHLREGSPGINGGTDHTDIGIYGTASPYKPSAVPNNPHFRQISIPGETTNGILPVKIQIEAQDH